MPKRIRQQKLREMLREKKQKLLLELHQEIFENLGDEYRREFESAMDAGDVSMMDLLQSVDIQLADIQRDEIIKMEAAERKLDEGTYGICEECGKDISTDRLAALPYAIRCFACEENLERKAVHGRGPTM
jgi:DnaK suppressor protein